MRGHNVGSKFSDSGEKKTKDESNTRKMFASHAILG